MDPERARGKDREGDPEVTRRTFLCAAIAAALPERVDADDRGARRRDRHNRQCAAWARTRLRRGLTAKERAFLERRGCKEEGGAWMSALFFTADDVR